MIGYNLPDDVDEAELARYMREKKPPCSNCNKAEAKAERYRKALEGMRKIEEAKAILKKHNFVFDNLEDRWQKLAFTFYADLCQIDSDAKQALDEER